MIGLRDYIGMYGVFDTLTSDCLALLFNKKFSVRNFILNLTIRKGGQVFLLILLVF